MSILKVKSVDVANESNKNFAAYTEILTMVEKLHKGLIDIVRFELDRNEYSDINSIQALLLFNIGDAKLSAGELRSRGYYMGTNVSYNLKKLIEFGYVNHKRSDSDKRSVRVDLTEKGQKVSKLLAKLYHKHAQIIEKVGDINFDSMITMKTGLVKLERFWYDQIRYRL